MAADVDVVEVGFVSRPHGTRGELRVVAHNPQSTSLSRATVVYVDGERRQLLAARAVEGAWLITLDGVPDRTAADRLRGAKIAVDRAALALADGEVLLADLIGCDVVLPDGSPWGRVAAITPGPQDLLVIHDGAVERLLPLVDELVVDIDVTARRIVVDPPEDLPETPRRLSNQRSAVSFGDTDAEKASDEPDPDSGAES